ncbi:hypothetical protein [Polyangium sp. 15x6]|uniref:hypothetical protein n=1 Tax=Polyangium sp. 15x6 TaxID=3042687 RepID=UPI00249B3C7B|nr:hypothetical protein [Polyangium sp. 15x6]MDI3289192.1 hypothetical protein [Polyangium sp. 15x6]
MKTFLPVLVVLGATTTTSLALAQLNLQFWCADRQHGNTGYHATFSADGSFGLNIEGREPVRRGTYSFTGDRVSMTVPYADSSRPPWSETSEALEMHWGIPIAFRTPSLSCHVVRHHHGPGMGTRSLECESTYFSHSGVSFLRENTFSFFDHHHVRRFSSSYVSTSSAPGTDISSTSTGIYFIEGDRIFMAFGREEDAEDRYLTGTINADGSITVDQPSTTCR